MSKNNNIFLLFWGLAVWVFMPIIGIFFLLLYVQSNLLKDQYSSKNFSFLNNLVLILVILTSSIFFSSFTVSSYSDTARYIDIYKNLDWNTLFNLRVGNGLEVVTFLLAYPIRYLTNSSPYWFLFNQSFIINTLVVFVIGKGISKKYYPLLLIIVFSTTWYNRQIFLMRQFLSVTFLMAAIVTIESRISFWIYTLLSFFSHLSSLPYILILVITKTINKDKENRIKKVLQNFKVKKPGKSLKLKLLIIMILAIGSAILVKNITGIAFLMSYLLKIIDFNQAAELVESKSLSYSSKDTNSFVDIISSLSFLLLFLIMFYKKYNNLSLKSLTLIIVFIAQLSSGIILVLSGSFNRRICLLFFVFQGFFYCLALEEKKKILNWLVWGYALFSVVFFIRYLVLMPSHPVYNSDLVFFQGKPLERNIYDYIIFFLNAQIN